MELDWTAETVGGVTLVSLRLQSDRTVDRRVRLRNRLDGPVLPPRRQREPESGWDREGFTTIVPAGGAVAGGYACPAPADEPPVMVAEVGRPDCTADGSGTVDDEPVADVIRRLGDARPPRAVVGDESAPTDADGEDIVVADEPAPSGTDRAAERTSRVEEGVGEETRDENDSAAETVTIEFAPSEASDGDDPSSEGDDPGSDGAQPDCRHDRPHSVPRTELPAGLQTALAPYRGRVETVEALGLASVTEATALLEAKGGIDEVERVGHRLDADAAALRALAVEATALAARAEAATAPVDALRRLS